MPARGPTHPAPRKAWAAPFRDAAQGRASVLPGPLGTARAERSPRVPAVSTPLQEVGAPHSHVPLRRPGAELRRL